MPATVRRQVNKKLSAKKFRKQAKRTKGANMAGPVMRGGIRF